MRKTIRILLRGLKILSVIIGVFLALLLGIGTVVVPTAKRISNANKIDNALDHAKSVDFVAFTRIYQEKLHRVNQVNLRHVVATPKQIEQFRKAIGSFIDVGFPVEVGCYNPHHRVEITETDGSVQQFEVCFECNYMKFNTEQIVQMPLFLRKNLERFFTNLGMIPLPKIALEKRISESKTANHQRKKMEVSGFVH